MIILLNKWDVAKLVRHLTLNQAIVGANPAIPIKIVKNTPLRETSQIIRNSFVYFLDDLACFFKKKQRFYDLPIRRFT